MRDDGLTDVTVELFNGCAGSCTGCLLTAEERRSPVPVISPAEFGLVCDALVAHGARVGLRYRAVVAFGDVVGLPADTQRRYYDMAVRDGVALGATMTLVEADRDATYQAGIDALLAADPGAVFDITVDPVRLARDPGYGERLRRAIARAPTLHLAALLSEVVLTRLPPEELAAQLSVQLLGNPVSLGFTPSIARFSGANYGYDVASAADYARRFYGASPEGRRHLAAEVERFRAAGPYSEFIKQTFHIGAGLEVYPTAYTVFGDIVLDARNRRNSLGSLKTDDLTALLDSRAARRLSMKAATAMYTGDFGCPDCRHFDSCVFNGVGAARELYGDFEFRAGACYGPASLEDDPGEARRAPSRGANGRPAVPKETR